MIALRPITKRHGYRNISVLEGREIPKDLVKLLGGEEHLIKSGLAKADKKPVEDKKPNIKEEKDK